MALTAPLLRSACTRCWSLLHRPALPRLRAARLHSTTAAKAAAASAAEGQLAAAPAAQPLPEVEPPPTVPFSPEALNSVAVSGVVLSEPQMWCFPPDQYKAHVRLGLRPRAHRQLLPHQAYGAATVDCFGALALQLAQHVRKGSRIQVRGVLKENVWTDKASGEVRRMLKIVAEELALLAPAEHEQEEAHTPLEQEQRQGAQQAQQGTQQGTQQAAQQAAQQQPQAQQAVPAVQAAAAAEPQGAPRFTSKYNMSAEQSRIMFERQGLGLGEIAAARGLKPSTVTDHLVAAGRAGALSSWQRLASELQLGPPSPQPHAWLTPAEVAAAVAAEQQLHPQLALAQLPLKPIRTRLESDPHTAPKVAALLAARGGDPYTLYGAVKLVFAMLDLGLSFSLVQAPPPEQQAPPF